MAEYWYPVPRASALNKKPVRVMLKGEALVVFRSPEGLACLRDMSPHRAASFSRGEAVGDTIQCPHHGWRFNKAGHCTHIPLLEGALPKYRARRCDICQSDGLIFVCRNARDAVPVVRPLIEQVEAGKMPERPETSITLAL